MSEPATLAMQIGELVIRCSLVTIEHLEDSVRLAEKMNIPLGRVLAMNNYMTEHAVDGAAELKQKIDAKEISLESAVKALTLIAHQGITVAAAIRQITPGVPKFDANTMSHKLGDLMKASGIISPQQLNQGVHNSLNTGLPLGMALMDMNLISPAVLEWCLTALQLVDSKVLTKEQAIQALRGARLRGTTLAQSLIAHGFTTSAPERRFDVPELLVVASVITEKQLLAAREIELVEGKALRDVLTECAMASEFIWSAAEELFTLVRQGVIGEQQASVVVRKLVRAATMEEKEHILANLESELEARREIIDLNVLLMDCGALSAEDLAIATPLSAQSRTPVIKVLLDAGVLSPATVHAAHQCQQFIESRAIEKEQGEIALRYALEQGTPFLEALTRFGWNHVFMSEAVSAPA